LGLEKGLEKTQFSLQMERQEVLFHVDPVPPGKSLNLHQTKERHQAK